MRYLNMAAILGLAFFVGCAAKETTSQQKIESVGLAFQETDQHLTKAEEELTSFEESLADLRSSASASKEMRNKSEFDTALARLARRVEQARLDIQELKTTNSRGRNAYERRLDETADQIQKAAAE